MNYKRQIRIEGKPMGLSGFHLSVTDSTSGEPIEHIKCIDVHLEPKELIVAHVTYWDYDDDTKHFALQDGEPVGHQVLVHNPTVAFSALEAMPPLDRLVYEAIGHMLRCARLNQDGVWEADSKRAVGIVERLIWDIKQLEVE